MEYPATSQSADPVRFGLLGPLLVTSGAGQVAVLRAAKQRTILAALLINANATVSADRLAEILWEGCPPPSAATAVRNYVMRLRRQAGPARTRIVGRPAGYAVEIRRPAEFDVTEAHELRRDATAAAKAGQWPEASAFLSTALSLWRGEPLADIPRLDFTEREVAHLAELRFQLTEARIEADLHLARHDELVAELRQLAAAHPLREHVQVQLMLALYRCGRQAEALEVYRNTRATLADELGADPGPELQEMHQRILTTDPELAVAEPWPMARPTLTVPQGRPIPRQLPAGVAQFVGRERELEALDGLLARATAPPAGGTVVISAIGGTAGIGKTALAVHWAHQVVGRFGDGQLYVDLRGFDPSGTPATVAAAIRGFLDALGVPPERMPASPEAQVGLYRSLLSGKRMLILLDNARDEQQVRPLLPASPASLIIVTSRNQLSGLAAADGARLLILGVLTHGEAVQLLTARLGSDQAAEEPGAVGEIADLCECLPLALAVAAARAAARPGFPLAALAAELRDAADRLDALDSGDPATSVRAVFSWSYQQLNDESARMFRLLGLHPGPDLSVPAAASLAGTDEPGARRTLGELARAHLIAEHHPGRYALHDLLRVYAAEQTHHTDTDSEQRAAISRLLDHYLHTAHAAALLLGPTLGPLTLAAPAAGTRPERPADSEQAMAWFAAEHQVLLALASHAAASGFDTHAWQIPWAMEIYLDRQGHWDDLAATQLTALAAAERLGNKAGQAHLHRNIGHARFGLGSYDDARAHLSQALTLYQQLGDKASQGRSHLDLALISGHLGRSREDLAHSRQALHLSQEAGDQKMEAWALNSVGWTCAHLGDHGQALDACERALEITRQAGISVLEAAVWDSLGYIRLQLGQHAQAITCYHNALTIRRHSGERYQQAVTLAGLGDAWHSSGDLDAARGAWREALTILDDLGHHDAAQLRAKLASIGPVP